MLFVFTVLLYFMNQEKKLAVLFILGDYDMPDDLEVGSGFREQVSGNPGAKVERNSHGQYLVRGRLFDPKSKPKTFNQVQESSKNQTSERTCV